MKPNKIPVTIKDYELEIAMRDALDGMLELSLEAGFRPTIADFEILEISPELPPKDEVEGEVLDFPSMPLASVS